MRVHIDVIVQIRDRGLYRDFKYEEFVPSTSTLKNFKLLVV